jgi:hypothetical protein
MWSPTINYLDNSGKMLTSNEKLNQHVMNFFRKKKNLHCATNIFISHLLFVGCQDAKTCHKKKIVKQGL